MPTQQGLGLPREVRDCRSSVRGFGDRVANDHHTGAAAATDAGDADTSAATTGSVGAVRGVAGGAACAAATLSAAAGGLAAASV